MAIRVMEDVLPQLATSGVNIIGRTTLPDWHDWLVYGMTAIGYTVDAMGLVRGPMGGFIKEMGKASLPLSADKLYERFSSSPVARTSTNRVAKVRSRTIRQTPQPGFADPSLRTY